MNCAAKDSISAIKEIIERNNIDTVRLGAVDLDGAWRGKQVSAEYFLKKAVTDGTQISNILFGWDCADELVDGLAYTSWDTGYPDIALVPDLTTFSVVPWEPQTATVICDMRTLEGEVLHLSPRED